MDLLVICNKKSKTGLNAPFVSRWIASPERLATDRAGSVSARRGRSVRERRRRRPAPHALRPRAPHTRPFIPRLLNYTLSIIFIRFIMCNYYTTMIWVRWLCGDTQNISKYGCTLGILYYIQYISMNVFTFV